MFEVVADSARMNVQRILRRCLASRDNTGDMVRAVEVSRYDVICKVVLLCGEETTHDGDTSYFFAPLTGISL